MEISEKAVRSRKLYYGWYIVILAFFAQLMTTGLRDYTLGVFMKPMIDDMGWSRTEISGAQSTSTVVNGLLAPFLGGILDRRGGRELMLFGTIVTGIGFASLGFAQEMWQFFIIRGFVMTVGVLCLGNLVVNVALSNWFIRKRGRAIALAAMGASAGGVTLAPLAQVLIDNFGWRSGWIVLGVMVWVVMFVPSALIMRRRPEDMGLLPDGDSTLDLAKAQTASTKALVNEARWTRAEAMRTPTLWLIIAAFGIGGMGQAALIMHVVPYVSDLGFSAAVATSVLAVQSTCAMLSKPVWGLVIERISVRVVAMIAFAFAASGIGLLIGARSLEIIYLALAIFGLGMGGNLPIQEVVWASYFGRLTLGTIRSIGMPFMIISGAGGPFMAGFTYDLTGSYQGAFTVFVCTYILAIALMLILRPPVHPKTSVEKAPA